jgi:hypothetical protein
VPWVTALVGFAAAGLGIGFPLAACRMYLPQYTFRHAQHYISLAIGSHILSRANFQNAGVVTEEGSYGIVAQTPQGCNLGYAVVFFCGCQGYTFPIVETRYPYLGSLRSL